MEDYGHKKSHPKVTNFSTMVPKAGLEPARISTVDFESTASNKSLIIITNLLRTYGSYSQFRQQIAPAK
ncbi:hypothetical protein [Klebsiella quasipneumoniae]|uniref:hypothetical protein n=1 Tax=Klebsiella quasipneumoniae TaxID=1463165 RepID=UPI0010B388BE|nr:hypothetical protein [Klebsiella quasipneumoniae]VGI57894.1 Uncharacterised protein [Klebsiella quasipneumoniae]